MDLPALDHLLEALEAYETDSDSYAAARDRLLARRAELTDYGSIDELAYRAFDEDAADSAADELVELIVYLRAAISRPLRSSQYFVASEVIDSIVFDEFSSDSDDPATRVLERLVESRAGAEGLLVFGLHSLGLEVKQTAGFLGGSVEFLQPEWGLALTSQTNRLSDTIAFLDRVREQFGIDQPLDTDAIEHWHRSRPASWLAHNPLLVMRVAEASGSYYGTEQLLLMKLEAGAALLAAIAAMHPASSKMTTAVINNVETFDIHHYMVLSPARSGSHALGGDFVPISRASRAQRAISSLPITLDIEDVATNFDRVTEVWHAIEKIYAGYLAHSFDHDTEDGRRYRKWFESLRYFRHSLGGRQWDSYVALSVAFESLLTEDAQSDKSKKIRRRLKELTGLQKPDAYDQTLQHLYRARVELLHSGLRSSTVDLGLARRAYVDALVGHVNAIT